MSRSAQIGTMQICNYKIKRTAKKTDLPRLKILNVAGRFFRSVFKFKKFF